MKTSSPMFYADIRLSAGASIPLDPDYDERAVYTVAGEVEIAGDVFGPAQLLVFKPGDRITVRAKTNARFMALGGEPMDGPRHIWWNFVSSRQDRIEQAKADWKMARFDAVPGELRVYSPSSGLKTRPASGEVFASLRARVQPVRAPLGFPDVSAEGQGGTLKELV